MPRHDGIRIATISTDDGAGYLLIQVERSERRPHRCEAGEKQYYKRSGDSSFAMEHYDIEDSFRRLAVSKLRAIVDVKAGSLLAFNDGKFKSLEIRIRLENKSLVSARYPYLILHKTNANQPPYLDKGKDSWGGADDNIHPGLSRDALRITHAVKVDSSGKASRFDVGSVTVEFSYGCYNSRPQKETLFLSPEDVMDTLGL